MRWSVPALAIALLVMAAPAHSRVQPGTFESMLPDGTRQVVTDGRATLFMDLGAARVELRLGPRRMGEPAVRLHTSGSGLVTHSLADLAPDLRLTSEIHVGIQWMMRYVVDRQHRVLLLAVGDIMGTLVGGTSEGTQSAWVALSLATGEQLPVDRDLVVRTHLASAHGQEGLADDLRRDLDRVKRLERVAAD